MGYTPDEADFILGEMTPDDYQIEDPEKIAKILVDRSMRGLS